MRLILDNKNLLDRYLTKQNGWFTPRLPSHEVKQFLSLISNENHSSLILDIGSGSCSDALYLKQKGVKVVSVDVDGCPDRYGDLRSMLPFPDSCTEAVFCRGVLHILSDIDQIHAVREIYRILQPKGLFYATFMVSIFADKRYQLITVDDYFGMNLNDYFTGQWSKSKIHNHGDHCHYFGKYIGYKK